MRCARLSVAGSSSIAGTRMCAVMIDWTPASIAARKGTSSRARSVSRSTSIVGSSRCESARVDPCPGKCFAHAATPTAWSPVTNAAVCRATSAGSEPNERTPMIGLRSSELMSATGARSRLTPAAASSPPIAAATRSVSATSSTAPSARFPG